MVKSNRQMIYTELYLYYFKNYHLNDKPFFVFDFFFQTFNGNFDQNTVEKQILFSAFVARYLRFVVGSKHGGACLRVEVSGVPRRRGLIYCRNCSGFKEYSFLPSCGTFLRIIEKILFLFATTSALSFF